MHTILQRLATLLLFFMVSALSPVQANNACLKGDALERAFREARTALNTRVKTMEYAEAMAPLRAYAIHYWMERNTNGAKDSLTRYALSGCWSKGCGEPPRGKDSTGQPTRFQSLLSYNYQLSQFEGGHRKEPPQPPSAFPPGEMLVWADQQLDCDWSLPAANQFVQARQEPSVKACPRGRDLTNSMIRALNAVPGNPKHSQAYVILYWQLAHYKVFEDINIMSALINCGGGNCGLPADVAGTRFALFRQYYQSVMDFKAKRVSTEPSKPIGAPFPDESMVEWAENALSCSLEPLPAAQPVTDDTEWAGYDEARQAGGALFESWWRKHMEMRKTADAFQLCRKFGASSYECGLVAEWTYLNSGKNPYISNGVSTPTGTYSDQGRNPYNAGYNGPKSTSGYNKPVAEPRCYKQGNGKEKCFYN